MVTVGDGIFDVVAGGVDKDALIIPGSALDSGVFMDRAESLQFSVADRDHMLGQECHCGHVRSPNHIPSRETKQISILKKFNKFMSYLVPNTQIKLTLGYKLCLHLPAFWDFHIPEVALLLNIKQGDRVIVTEEKHSGASIEYLIAVWSLNLLSYLILQILDDQLEHKKLKK